MLSCVLAQHRLWEGPTALLAPAGNMLSATMGDNLPTLASLTAPEQCSVEHNGDSIPRPLLILHGRKDRRIDPADSYLLAASHAGDNCRLLLCSEDDHRFRTICRGNLFTGMLVDLLCGIVGTMDDPVSGKPSHAGKTSTLRSCLFLHVTAASPANNTLLCCEPFSISQQYDHW